MKKPLEALLAGQKKILPEENKKELCRATPPKNLFQIWTFLLYSFLRYLMIAPLGKLPPLMHWRSGRSLSRRGTVEVVLQIYQYKVTSIDAQPYFIRTCFFSQRIILVLSHLLLPHNARLFAPQHGKARAGVQHLLPRHRAAVVDPVALIVFIWRLCHKIYWTTYWQSLSNITSACKYLIPCKKYSPTIWSATLLCEVGADL